MNRFCKLLIRYIGPAQWWWWSEARWVFLDINRLKTQPSIVLMLASYYISPTDDKFVENLLVFLPTKSHSDEILANLLKFVREDCKIYFDKCRSHNAANTTERYNCIQQKTRGESECYLHATSCIFLKSCRPLYSWFLSRSGQLLFNDANKLYPFLLPFTSGQFLPAIDLPKCSWDEKHTLRRGWFTGIELVLDPTTWVHFILVSLDSIV